MVHSTPPSSLHRGVSPPALGARSGKRRRIEGALTGVSDGSRAGRLTETAFPSPTLTPNPTPTPAAVEAGEAYVRDHLAYFTDQLSRRSRYEGSTEIEADNSNAGLRDGPEKNLTQSTSPREQKHLSIPDYRALYSRNGASAHGHHFVIHQHDHPRAGTHYDLRLQINHDSSCSWAIPYGLPGNPNERRHGRRQAIETRVHCLWNHLVESASHKSGSMLIWDTGEYEVLPFDVPHARMTDDEGSGVSADEGDRQGPEPGGMSESEKLSAAFRAGKIRLRLHGTRLPPGYTISMRLSHNAKEKISCRQDATRRPVQVVKPRRRKKGRKAPQTSDEESAAESGAGGKGRGKDDIDLDSDAEDDPEHVAIRANNAYPGARNTVGSMHQRWWFVAIDKAACGFVKGRNELGNVLWTPRADVTERRYPFYVKGRDFETSVVTGRKAADVLEDEGVEGYVYRSGWQPILN